MYKELLKILGLVSLIMSTSVVHAEKNKKKPLHIAQMLLLLVNTWFPTNMG